ncbi:MAG: P-loop ATPase, Sll1717 family, partial [Gallionellaceae bacterium]
MINYEEMFGYDSGEDEPPELLNSYFVMIPEFKKFFDSKQQLSIVRARKGMGKSSLISKLHNDLLQNVQSNIIIRVTGNDLITLGNFQSADQAVLENTWKEAICRRICIEIGSKIEWAFTDQKMSMVEAAEIAGYKDQNLVSALTQRIGGLIQTVLRASADSEVKPGSDQILKTGLSRPLESLRRYQEDENVTVWVLIDDV